jgi:hypothetical protein
LMFENNRHLLVVKLKLVFCDFEAASQHGLDLLLEYPVQHSPEHRYGGQRRAKRPQKIGKTVHKAMIQQIGGRTHSLGRD